MQTLQAQLTLSEDTLAKEWAELQKKIEEAEDKSIDLAWYRMWVNNLDLELSFLDSEQDRTLAILKARLAEEDELMTYSEAAPR